jgi:hypothetical protein
MNNYIIEGLIDTRASMSVITTNVVRELGIMHEVMGSKYYKIALGVVTQVMGEINKLSIRVGKMVCKMNFAVVDTDGYDVLLSLDFLINIGGVVDIEQQFIQICHGLRANVQVLPLNMVNILQKMNDHLIFEL